MAPKKPNPVREYMREIGSRGGKAKAEGMTAAQRKKIGRDLAAARAKARAAKKTK